MDRNTDYDSKTVVLINKKLQREKNTQKVANQFIKNSTSVTNAAKVERDEEAGKKLKVWGKEYGKKITQARLNGNPKLNQVQLAKKLQVKPEVVKEIENGTGLYKPNIATLLFKLYKVKR